MLMSGLCVLFREGPWSHDTEPWQHAKPRKVHIMSKALKNLEGNRKIQVCCCAEVMKGMLFHGQFSEVTCQAAVDLRMGRDIVFGLKTLFSQWLCTH